MFGDLEAGRRQCLRDGGQQRTTLSDDARLPAKRVRQFGFEFTGTHCERNTVE
jgi:hypothetical protein